MKKSEIPDKIKVLAEKIRKHQRVSYYTACFQIKDAAEIVIDEYFKNRENGGR